VIIVGDIAIMSLPVIGAGIESGKAHVMGIADEVLSHETSPFQVHEGVERDANVVKQEGLTQEQRKFAIWLGSISTFDIFLSGLVCVIAFAHAYRDTGVSPFSSDFAFLVSIVLPLRRLQV